MATTEPAAMHQRVGAPAMNWPRRKSRSTSVSSNLRERRRRSPLTFLCSSHAAMPSTVSSLCSERRTTPLSRLLRNSREVRGLCVDESRDGRHERPARPGSDIGDRPLASAAAASAAGTAAAAPPPRGPPATAASSLVETAPRPPRPPPAPPTSRSSPPARVEWETRRTRPPPWRLRPTPERPPAPPLFAPRSARR